jgi:galactokinase
MDRKELKKSFNDAYGDKSKPLHYFFAPGRVNLIGEHIDYNGGAVFPAALSLGIYGVASLRRDRKIYLTSTNTPLQVIVDLDEPIRCSKEDGWANYPKGVIQFLLGQGCELQGYDILFSGNLPDGAGLSSSAALLVLTAFMLRHVSGEEPWDGGELAIFCQKVENEFVKVNCGIMDQFAVAMGRQDSAILLECETLHYKYIPFVLGEYGLVIMNTNKKRELAESKYNQRRDECEEVLKIIRQHHPIDNLCQGTLGDIEDYIENPVLQRRAYHVISENKRVYLAANRLEQGDILGFGQLMIQSHTSLKNDYEVTGVELDCIVEEALKVDGCIGARMTGAGFGGCGIALVKNEKMENFKNSVSSEYYKITGLKPSFYVAQIADGVKTLEE